MSARKIVDLTVWFIFPLCFFLFVFRFFLLVVIVNGDSMLPTYSSGQVLVAVRTSNAGQDDVIVFSAGEDRNLIKRVAATAGQTVTVKDGRIYVDGKEGFDPDQETFRRTVTLPHKVEEEAVFVLGDNRGASLDSRYIEIGDVPTENIKGRILFRIPFLHF